MSKLFPKFDIHGPDGTLYLRRRNLLRIPFLRWKLMLHHIIRPDYARELHDHPWWFLTFILWGGYSEITGDGEHRCRVWRFYFRRARFSHAITKLHRKSAWTLVLRGRRVRDWGFHTKCGWQQWKTYCDKTYNGLPICEESK